MERVRAPRSRVGFDRLGVALMLAAALCALLPYGWIASLPLVAWAVARALSTHFEARYKEEAVFMKGFDVVVKNIKMGWRAMLGSFRNWGARAQERKAYKVFACPTCKQKQRVPRGKGRIRITCKQCGAKFEGRT